jgi:hypothetical protein
MIPVGGQCPTMWTQHVIHTYIRVHIVDIPCVKRDNIQSDQELAAARQRALASSQRIKGDGHIMCHCSGTSISSWFSDSRDAQKCECCSRAGHDAWLRCLIAPRARFDRDLPLCHSTSRHIDGMSCKDKTSCPWEHSTVLHHNGVGDGAKSYSRDMGSL